jgi:uracil-DNA glycosylase
VRQQRLLAKMMVAQQNLKHLVDSYQNWWAVAGVDTAFGDEPYDMLTQPKRDEPVATPQSHAHGRPAAPAQSYPPPIRDVSSPTITGMTQAEAIPLPTTLGDFQDWLRHHALLPGAFWSPQRAGPHGAVNPRLMVIGDQPDPVDLESGKIFSGPAGALLDAMLAAIQITPDRVYKASFSITRNIKGAMKATEKASLVRIARHHISLVNPDYVLILGRNTGLALMDYDVTIPAQSLREINHLSGSVPVIGTFHPRAMLEQSALKKQAWETLKILAAHMKITG